MTIIFQILSMTLLFDNYREYASYGLKYKTLNKMKLHL